MIESLLLALGAVWNFICITIGMFLVVLGLTAVLSGGKVTILINDSNHSIVDHCFGKCEKEK